MHKVAVLGMLMPYCFATMEFQDLFVGLIIVGSTIAYIVWLVKRKL